MAVSSQKSDFPVFSNSPHVYLDSAATTHKPWPVITAMTDFYGSNYGTIRRGLYQLSSETTNAYECARQATAKFIGAKHIHEIIFTSGATEGINFIASAYLEPFIRPEDEIIISIQEHHANFLPWQNLAKKSGATLCITELDSDGDIVLSDLIQKINNKTKLIAVTHVSNVLGSVNPIKKITAAARKEGAKVLVDAAQSVGHLPINVQDIDCDFLVFSAHKMFGPTGTGVLYIKENVIDEVNPYRFGGEMVLRASLEKSTFKKSPQKFEAGTPNIAGVLGLHAAIKYIEHIGISTIMEYEKSLTSKLLNLFREHRIKIIGDPKIRSGILSFLIDDIHPHDAATILAGEGIAVRAGHHCAQPLLTYLRIPATVRASLAWYNDEEDLYQLIAGIQKVRKLMQ